MKRMIFGESVQGASHKRVDKECQDSFKKIEYDDGTVIMAIADGHGSKACPYSKSGSSIAVNVFCKIMDEFYTSYAENLEMLLTYLNREGDTKVAQAVDAEWKRRVLKVHTNQKREVPLTDNGEKNRAEIYKQRFIHKDQFRLMQPCGNNRQLLLHAVGIGGDGLRQIACQFKKVSVFTDTCLPVRGADIKNIRNEIQIFNSRHVIIQIGIIGDISKAALTFQRLRPDGFAVNINFSGVKLQNACHGFQGRCLACTVMTDKPINFTGAMCRFKSSTAFLPL